MEIIFITGLSTAEWVAMQWWYCPLCDEESSNKIFCLYIHWFLSSSLALFTCWKLTISSHSCSAIISLVWPQFFFYL